MDQSKSSRCSASATPCRRRQLVLRPAAAATVALLLTVLRPACLRQGLRWPEPPAHGRRTVGEAFVRPKLEWPPQKALTKADKDALSKLALGETPQQWPRDGQRLGLEGTSVAVRAEDLDRLASEPLPLRVDRHGKAIAEGEAPGPLVPWSTHDASGMSSAAAPQSWEEFAARYEAMDRRAADVIGREALKQVQERISAEVGRDDYRTVRTFSWAGGGAGSEPSSIMLIGVTETSARSRQLAARAVYEAEPSALLVQLCRERIGRRLVMPAEHLATIANYARGYAAGNPHRLRRELYMADMINGDYEALGLWMGDLAYGAAVEEFARVPGDGRLPKVLCLGDVLASRWEELRKQRGNETLKGVPALSARGKQLARGLIALSSLGHRVVLGVVSVDLLAVVTTWLERAGARFVATADASDIEAGRESLAADARLGLEPGRPPPGALGPAALGVGRARLGAFLGEEGLRLLAARRQRLAALTRVRDLVRHCEPPKLWRVAELLGGGEGELSGPGQLQRPRGLRLEFGQLEVPEAYLREAGAEQFGPELWRTLREAGAALETRDLSELEWWLAGGVEA